MRVQVRDMLAQEPFRVALEAGPLHDRASDAVATTRAALGRPPRGVRIGPVHRSEWPFAGGALAPDDIESGEVRTHGRKGFPQQAGLPTEGANRP